MKIHGTCHCGAIAFEAELDPDRVGICHCTDCQAMSASAFRTLAIVTPENFRLIRGRPKEYIKTGDSGARRIQAFCPTCGAGIYATNADGAPTAFNLRAGTIAEREQLIPRFQCWTGSALPWIPEIPDTKVFPGNPG